MAIMVRTCVSCGMSVVFQNDSINPWGSMIRCSHQMLATAMSDIATAKATTLAKTGMSFPRQTAWRIPAPCWSSSLSWLCQGSALWSMYDVNIRVLNKRMDMNSNSMRTDSSLLVILGLMDYTSVPCLYWPPHPIPLYKCLNSIHVTVLEPTYNINWSAGGKRVDCFSSILTLLKWSV